MPYETTALPHDSDALTAIVVQQAAEIERLSVENQRQQAHLGVLEEKLNILLAKRFGASSEKYSPDQLRLFNEAERDGEGVDVERPPARITIPTHQRLKPGRKPLPTSLPRIEVVHELEEAERVCTHDGHRLIEIGEELSEQLDIIPAQVQVIRHVRKKYACPHCAQGVKTAPLPPQAIPKSLASAGLLAQVAVAKYQDARPLYRQERILQRIGVDLPRATLAQWMIKLGALIQPLINLLREQMLSYDLLQMDETTVQVLKEPGKTAQSQSYLWVQRGGPIVLYEYDPSRSQAVPKRLLEGYRGYLQIDGYEGYNAVCACAEITPLGCWAHSRRRFDEAVKAQGKNAHPTKTSKAMQGLAYIQQLYRIEQEVRGQRLKNAITLDNKRLSRSSRRSAPGSMPPCPKSRLPVAPAKRCPISTISGSGSCAISTMVGWRSTITSWRTPSARLSWAVVIGYFATPCREPRPALISTA